MEKSFLSQIQGFSTDSLKHVDTQLTTKDGKRVSIEAMGQYYSHE